MKLDESKIMAYLLGELSAEEEVAVRDAIAKDAQWQQVTNEYQKLLTGFRQERVNRYAAEVSPDTPPSSTSSGSRKSWLWLLLFGIVFTAGLLWALFPTAPDFEDLAQTYFILPADPTVAGQSDVSATYQEGIKAFFRDRDYPAAATAFARIQEDSLLGQRVIFYLGHARFLTQDYQTAQSLLDSSLKQEAVFSRFERQDLAWNILMARLAQGENIRAELIAFPERESKTDLLEQLPEQ